MFHLPFRQTEGFVRSVFELVGVALEAPDHPTLSRRSRQLDVALNSPLPSGPIDLIIDSTGLSIFGEGEWAAAKHGRRGSQGWKKLHLGVDENGAIVAQKLTGASVDDAKTGVELIEALPHELRTVIGDGAYDTRAFYTAAEERGADVVVPPIKTAKSSAASTSARQRTVDRVAELGRRQWMKRAGCHRQGKVENAFFRWKTIIGDRLRARGARAQTNAARIASRVLNRMLQLGRPNSVAIET